MKSVGVLTSGAREHHAPGASLAAMLLVMIAYGFAAAQSVPDTTTSEGWKTAAASAPAPSNLVPTPPDVDATQPAAAEIPTATSAAASQQQSSPEPVDSHPAAESQPPNESNDVARYQEEQSGIPPEQMRGIQQFDSEGELSTPFGMQLREAKRTLKSGEDADGLLITAVDKGSPAAAVGLRAYSHGVHDVLTGVAMAGALVPGGQFAVLLIPAMDYMQIGESYDMIIGVDGSRVTNFLDFQDRMRDLQPGEVIYLSVLRDGKRLQVTMPVPANILQATN
ncbi:MAG TPA: PDZ domain-containing protein [Candidatus Acidoferrum sp.]|nr:PDZ domain-containing protein [Candidatus Acidoferrum sp.]